MNHLLSKRAVTSVPVIVPFATFVVLAVRDAGYPVTVWSPVTLFLLALLVTWVVAGRAVRRHSGWLIASLGGLVALTVWTYVSIAWSDVEGEAWDGANRGVLYLVVFALVLVSAPPLRAAAIAVGGYAAAITVAGVITLVRVSRSPTPEEYFLIGRFAEPTDYQNANSALFTLALWPALFLAARREVPLLLRAVFLAAAGVLVELALLSQSRGWLAALPITFVLYVALVPQRVRTLVFAAPVAVVVLAARRPVLDVYTAVTSGDGIRAALQDARSAVATSALVLVIVGVALAAMDERFFRDPATRARLRVALGGAFAAAAVVAAVAGLVWLGNPVTRVERAWDEFSGAPMPARGASYLTSGFGSNRYDLWRVALREVSREPLTGVGSDNFAVDYLRERRSHEEVLYPHSVELKILAQTGIVGAVFFLLFLAGAIGAWFRRRRDGPSFADAFRATCLVGFAYWLVHGSIDWFWELPGLAAPAFALLGLAAAADRTDADRPRERARFQRASLAALVVAGLVAAASLAAPWLAAKEREAALHEWRRAPDDAFDRLGRARRLNPLSDESDVLAGVLASRRGQTRLMAAAFERALERNPYNWYSRLELGVAYAKLGRRAAALRELAAALRLNPREPTIPVVTDRVRRGLPVSTAELDRTFFERIHVSNRKDS